MTTLKQIFIEQLTSEGISWEATLILEGQMLPLFKAVNKKWLQQKHLDYLDTVNDEEDIKSASVMLQELLEELKDE